MGTALETYRAGRSPVFLYRLVPQVRGGRWLAGIAIFVLLLGLFWAAGVFREPSARPSTNTYGVALFFCTIIAYIIPVFDYISARTEAALRQLRPDLRATDEEFTTWFRQIRCKPGAWLAITLLIGTLGWLGHTSLLFGSPWGALMESARSSATAATVLGTVLTWTVLTLVLSALLDNAFLLRRLAARTRIELLRPQRVRPYASVAVTSTLAIIGGQAAFPLMFVEADVEPSAYLPGLTAMTLSMLLLAGVPIWSIHRCLARAKQHLLEQVDRRIAQAVHPGLDHPGAPTELAAWLAYRREVRETSEWPFDQGVATRLALYLFIPPLTWVGAALIENVVDLWM